MRRLSILCSFIVFFCFYSFGQHKEQRHDVQFYFDSLPDTCFYLCDWRNLHAPNAEKVVDIYNGFISFNVDKEFSDHFQLALFKGTNNKDIIAVSTRECEAFACFHPTAFFFIYEEEHWAEADTMLLPEITTKLFYDDSVNSEFLNKYGYFRYHYILPRYGTEIKIELSICDYLQFDYPEITDHQYDKLIRERKPVYLKWEKNSNQFKIRDTRDSKE